MTDLDELIAELREVAGVNPLNVTCGECGSKPGKRCYGNGEMRRTHSSRASKAEHELRAAAADALEAATRERDAAVAAIERVRDLANSLRDRYADNSDAAYFTKQFLAELGGAPEPETTELFPGTNAALDRLTVRKAAPAEAFCIEHGNFHAVELGDPTCEFEDGFGEPVDGEKP